eukprot:GHVO01033543.1.p2 GENE.GHVO01033543.1~~GHVO01033543.1.p2  ORF type:complete len:201 (+),score=13.93 GHVO01033543.1:718-1320(+)
MKKQKPSSSSRVPEVSRFGKFQAVFTSLFDRTIPYWKLRWLVLLMMLGLFTFRVYQVQGYFVVAYMLAIYVLNCMVGFVTPEKAVDGDSLVLPVSDSTEEYRPFPRALPEFVCWTLIFRATTLSLVCTTIEFFNLPVYWPLLVVYFIILFAITIKHQVTKMLKHRYIPVSLRKQTYGSITRNVAPVPKAKAAGMFKSRNS